MVEIAGSEDSMVRLGGIELGAGVKRKAEEDEIEGDLKGRKKARVSDLSGDEMKRVAEIVMVLSAMREIRGGKDPTEVEEELMGEARVKLVKMCETMKPQDVIPKDAIRVITDDLGLRRDQRAGHRPPRMSIAEKMQLTKTKMEDSKKFAAQAVAYSSQLPQAGVAAKTESSISVSPATHRFPPDKPSSTNVSTGGFGAVSPMVNVSAPVSTSSSNQAFVNEVKSSIASRGLQRSPMETNSSSLMPRKEAGHFGLDGRSNGSTFATQTRGTNGDQTNKVPHHSHEMRSSQTTIQATRDSNSKPSQSVHQPSQAINPNQLSQLQITHSEISKHIQKFLHPTLQQPNWIPPSKDYMNKCITCQKCKDIINDVETLLVCDACEKGLHLKCLPSQNQNFIPKFDWHCPSCMASSNGKPFPPKYGRVTRSSSAQKVPPITGGVNAQPSSVKKVEIPNEKFHHQNLTTNGNPDSSYFSDIGRNMSMSNSIESDTRSKFLKARELERNGPVSIIKSIPKETAGVVCGPPHPSYSINESSKPIIPNFESSPHDSQRPMDPKSPDGDVDTGQKSQEVKVEVTVPDNKVSENMYSEVRVSDLKETSECKPGCDVRKDDHCVAQPVSVGALDFANGGARDCIKSSLDGLHSVDWVGDPVQIADETAFYNSCHIKGMEYKMQEHALVHCENGNLRPSKLQAFWEDTKTNSQWASVIMCYFPSDLPHVVGLPCTPEDNEVYESNHGSTIRAGLIQGPCEVLPPNKFKEEKERRSHPGYEANDGLKPVFLCKWFYDELKSSFSAVTE
ncbi:hypothetical protein GIB67_013319 [Kingdonia uniflora]|uniref:PHD-type domain-containing protein n=1 Tax=Kingdonia uniflora TaxID=39325 RepID=A0A7J7LQZ4_9MAGN|nr:hypothetical protein GIB67_013319 [Kingdonia uniflora]